MLGTGSAFFRPLPWGAASDTTTDRLAPDSAVKVSTYHVEDLTETTEFCGRSLLLPILVSTNEISSYAEQEQRVSITTRPIYLLPRPAKRDIRDIYDDDTTTAPLLAFQPTRNPPSSDRGDDIIDNFPGIDDTAQRKSPRQSQDFHLLPRRCRRMTEHQHAPCCPLSSRKLLDTCKTTYYMDVPDSINLEKKSPGLLLPSASF